MSVVTWLSCDLCIFVSGSRQKRNASVWHCDRGRRMRRGVDKFVFALKLRVAVHFASVV